jgi:hypothetical protein
MNRNHYSFWLKWIYICYTLVLSTQIVIIFNTEMLLLWFFVLMHIVFFYPCVPFPSVPSGLPPNTKGWVLLRTRTRYNIIHWAVTHQQTDSFNRGCQHNNFHVAHSINYTNNGDNLVNKWITSSKCEFGRNRAFLHLLSLTKLPNIPNTYPCT